MIFSTKLWISFLSLQGAGRHNLEDCVLLRNRTDERYSLVGVSDGIGGLELGEAASDVVRKIFTRPIRKHPKDEIISKAREANEILFKKNERMGATLSIVAIDKTTEQFFALNIGDSRLYRYHDLTLEQIAACGKTTSLNFIGPNENLSELRIVEGSYAKGDCWLLTTDGVHSSVDDITIKETIQMYNKNKVATTLANQALNRSSRDDLTVVFFTIN